MKKSSNKVCDVASQGSQAMRPATRDFGSQTSIIEEPQAQQQQATKPPTHGCDKEKFRVAKMSGLLLRLMADMFNSSSVSSASSGKTSSCRHKTNR